MVCFAVLAVLILLFSNLPAPNGPGTGKAAKLNTSQLGLAANSTAFPYLVNTSAFPVPERFLNSSGNATLPQLTVTESGTSSYDLTWAQQWPNGTNALEFSAGSYNSSIASSIYATNASRTGGCTSHCPPSLPISWGLPSMIANYSRTLITATATASRGSWVASAATAANETYVYLGYDGGLAFPWANLTQQGAVHGTAPQLAISPCAWYNNQQFGAVLLTTLWQKKLTATTFPVSCVPNVNFTTQQHKPLISQPTITSIFPNNGTGGTLVTINGTNFGSSGNPEPTVDFAGDPSSIVSWKSSTQVTAVAPSLTGGPLPAQITITVGGLTSPGVPWAIFDYNKPMIASLVPSGGPALQSVLIHGLNFTDVTSVWFGATKVSTYSVVNPNEISATAPVPPPYTGAVNVRVAEGSEWTAVWPHDVFTYQLPAEVSTSISGAVVGAAPFFAPGPGLGYEEILATNATTGQVLDLNSTNLGVSFAKTVAGTFSAGLGSNVFATIGGTRLDTPGGPTGQVSVAIENSTTFAGISTESQGIIALETISSENGGVNWSLPYLTQPANGSLSDPRVAVSPAGYFYVTWREDGAGDWQVDQTVFSETGRMILAPQVLPGSGGASQYNAGPPSIAVDGLQRPLFVWGTPNATGSELRLTGAFLTPLATYSTLSRSLNQTNLADFNDSFGSALTYKSVVQGELGWLLANLSGSKVACEADTDLVEYVYPNVVATPFPAYYNLGNCPLVPPSRPSGFIAPFAGPLVASTYFSVYCEWLGEATGYEWLADPSWSGSPDGGALSLFPPLNATSQSYHPFDSVGHNVTTRWGDSLIVAPLTENPNSILFRNALIAPTNTSDLNSTPVRGQSCSWYYQAGTVYYSIKTTLTLTNHSNLGVPFTYAATSAREIPWIYLTNVTAGSWGTYTEEVSATAELHQSYSNNSGCPHRSWTSNSLAVGRYPGNFTLWANGTFLTVLQIANSTNTAKNVTVEIGPAYEGAENDSVGFNTSILTTQYAALNYSSNGTVRGKFNSSAPFYRQQYNDTFAHVPISKTIVYRLQIRVSTANGTPFGFNTSQVATSNTNWIGSNSTYSSPLTLLWGCSFAELQNPIIIGGNASSGISQVTATTANITWVSNASGLGWAIYHELRGTNFTATAQEVANKNLSTNHTYPYRYQVELHGLHAWGIYVVQVGVSSTQGCVTFENWDTWHFQTLTQVSLEEKDQAYDSISKQGGGAAVEWQVPAGFLTHASFTTGTFSYWPSNHTGQVTTISLTSLPPWIPNGPLFTTANQSYTFGENLTALNVSWNYSVSVVMNFSVVVPWGTYSFTAGSLPFTFWYLRDTSGDGLTDQEKLRGWEVTYEGANGSWVDQWTTANPENYSTNGLMGDYFEKEYGLNPRTVDTAGSHMLDGWNLTFNLGRNTSNLTHVPATTHLRIWNEEGTYVWNKTCQIFQLTGCLATYSFAPIAKNATNLTSAPYPAGYNWSSEVLYNGSASGSANQLTQFLDSPGVQNTSWLRAVLGTATINGKVDRILTVWGKLSWGANPLASSTPHDGIADGERVNAAHDVALDINISKVSYSGCPGAGGGTYAWALKFYLNYSTTGSGQVQLANWSSQTNYSGASCGSLTNYVLPMPINATSPNESLSIHLYVNEGTRSSPSWGQARVNASSSSPKILVINYSILRATTYKFKGIGSSTGGGAGYAHVFGNLSIAPIGTKDPTYLWQPSQNGTLGFSPWGLKRYTGEQDFDLIVVNATTAMTSGAIPSPLNPSVMSFLRLSRGLTTFMLPRAEFLESPLGDALSLAANLTDSSGSSPLIGTSNESGLLRPYTGTDPLDADICYWLNRIVNTTTNSSPIEHCALSGTGPSTNTSVFVSDISSSSQTNQGGDPSTPLAESGSVAGPALQSVVTFNISSPAEFDLLVAGLLDNRTGGLNGSFLQVTSEVQNLGFEPAIVNGVANLTVTSSGLYPYPAGSGWKAPGCNAACWENRATGVVVVAGVLFGGVVGLAIGAYLMMDEHKGLWLVDLGATLVARAVASVRTAASAALAALAALGALIESEVSALLSPLTTPIVNANNQYFSNLMTQYAAAEQTVASGHSVTQAEADAFWNAASGGLFEAVTGITTAVGVAVAVASTVCLGAGFLAPIIVGLVASGLGGTVGSGLLNSALSPPTTGSALVGAVQGFVDTTGNSKLKSATNDWPTVTQLFGLLLSASGFGALASIAIFSAVTTSLYYLGYAGILSLIFGFFSLLAYVWWINNGQTNTGVLIYSLVTGAVGVGTGVIGTVRSITPGTRIVAGIGAGLSTAGIALAIAT